jgi:hypothetical protein
MTIHLEVVAGLANRIRALISGICFAEDLGVPLVVHWYPFNRACACRIESLFDMRSFPSFVSFSDESLNAARECLSAADLIKFTDIYTKKGSIEIKSYGRFHTTDPERWLRHLRASIQPSTDVAIELEKRLSIINFSNVIGVHIRRGDNEKAIQQSPFQGFKMYLESTTGPFLLVTDDDVIKNMLSSLFSERCLVAAKLLSRESEDGMKEAAIDFFALARCPTILGSACSSFSEIAALYGSSTLTLMTSS